MLRSRRFVVRGHSMWPTLLPGDRVLVDIAAYRQQPPSLGEIVLVKGDRGSPPVLKRLAGHQQQGVREYLVLGDNRADSRDSRHFGPVRLDQLVGPAWYRYWPAARRGPLET